MRLAMLCLLALQLPVDGAPPDPDRDPEQVRRSAIETMNRGVAAFASADILNAERELSAAVEIDPDYVMARANLGRFYARQARWDEAQRELERASRAEGADSLGELHYELGRVRLASAGEDDFSTLERRAQLRAAIAAFDQATSIDPNDYRAHHLRASAYDDLDEPALADRSYRKCIEVQPRHVPCFVDLAAMYAEYGLVDLAAAVLDIGTQVNTIDAHMWLGAGEILLRADRARAAVEHAKKARTIDPELVDAHYVLGMAYAQLRMRTEALESLLVYQDRAERSDERRRYAHHMEQWLREPL